MEGKETASIFGYDVEGRIIRAVIDLEEARKVRDKISVMLNDVSLQQRIQEHKELSRLNDWSGLLP
ncbi:hypothetical protein D3C79_1026340 [compost metagenome]